MCILVITYSSNHGKEKLRPSLNPGSKSDTLYWRLVLLDVTLEDSGLYQCQVEGLNKVSKISKVTSLMVEDEESVLHREQYLISKSGGQVMLDCSDFSDIEGDVQVNWTHQRGKYFEHGRLLS